MAKATRRCDKGGGTLNRRGKGAHAHFLFRITVDGKEYSHNTRTNNLDEAKIEKDRFLRTLRPILPNALKPLHETVTVAELVDDYIKWQKDNRTEDDRDSTEDRERRLNAMLKTPTFSGRLAISITTADLQNYRDSRTIQGRAAATINYELASLRAAFNHGKNEQTPKKVIDVPHFPIVEPNNTRTGFLERDEYKRLLDCLCDSLKPFLVLAYNGGTRSGELKKLKWTQVNRRLGVIELEAKNTKTGDGRYLPIYNDMGEWLDKQFAIRNAECPDCEYVLFWHKADAKMGKAGTKLDTFPASWDRAIGQAGFETDGKDKLIPHDLRRSACRNLARVLPQAMIMKIMGHKTDSMFRRYNIVCLKDIVEAGKKLDAALADEKASQMAA